MTDNTPLLDLVPPGPYRISGMDPCVLSLVAFSCPEWLQGGEEPWLRENMAGKKTCHVIGRVMMAVEQRDETEAAEGRAALCGLWWWWLSLAVLWPRAEVWDVEQWVLVSKCSIKSCAITGGVWRHGLCDVPPGCAVSG